MNNKVKFSIFSLIITAAVIILSVAGIVSVRHNTEEVVIGSLIVGAVVIAGLYYCPVSVEANRSEINTAFWPSQKCLPTRILRQSTPVIHPPVE